MGGLALLLGKGGGRLFKEEASELLGMPLHTFADKDSWGHILARRWLKSELPCLRRSHPGQRSCRFRKGAGFLESWISGWSPEAP